MNEPQGARLERMSIEAAGSNTYRPMTQTRLTDTSVRRKDHVKEKHQEMRLIQVMESKNRLVNDLLAKGKNKL